MLDADAGGPQQVVDELRGRVREAEARASNEASRHAEAEARWKEELRKAEAELERLRTRSSAGLQGAGMQGSDQNVVALWLWRRASNRLIVISRPTPCFYCGALAVWPGMLFPNRG